jgi:ABC-type uncharacterized transport system substrate-binding protein
MATTPRRRFREPEWFMAAIFVVFQGHRWLRGLVVCVLLVAASGTAPAQTAARKVRIGVLSPDSPSASVSILVETLRETGWVEGRNAEIVARSGRGDPATLTTLAHELVELHVDVIVVYGTEGALAARHATSTIPIVMAVSGDPIRAGLVASLARPGGNVTGNAGVTPELAYKRLEVLRDVAPRARRIGIVGNPQSPLVAAMRPHDEWAADRLGMELVSIDIGSARDVDSLGERLGQARVEALVIYANPVVFAARRRIIDAANRRRLPTVSDVRDLADAGALLSFAPSPAALIRRAATTVDRVLRGVPPADLPVQQPAAFELTVNRRTARTLGLTVPPGILLRADALID